MRVAISHAIKNRGCSLARVLCMPFRTRILDLQGTLDASTVEQMCACLGAIKPQDLTAVENVSRSIGTWMIRVFCS